MVKITKGAKVECLKCPKQYDVSIDEFGEPDVEHEERDMGTEFHYTWQYKAKCKICGNDISVTVCGCEYPEGSLNDYDTESDGCNIIENPELEA